MSPELMMWFMLATKMAVTALFVTAATIIAERLGAMVGALVATLPVSAGPVYVFLALDHDSTFISSSAVVSLALNSATAIYLTAYVLIAQRHSMWLSISLAFVMWLAAVLMLSPVQWTAGSASALNLIVFTACIVIVQPFCLVRIPPTTRPWYDFVLRAGLVALLVGVIVTLSFQIGPTGSGVLAVFPVIYTSIHAHSASPRWRSCHGSRVGERRSTPRQLERFSRRAAWRSVISRYWLAPWRIHCLRTVSRPALKEESSRQDGTWAAARGLGGHAGLSN
jgi:hypothetical protein